MKIKKHGNLYKSVKCPVCGCKFEYSIYEQKHQQKPHIVLNI